jgi:hypothetical protein
MVLRHVHHVARSALHRLEDQHVAGDMLVDEVEREQRVAQVVEHAHEDHDVERSPSAPTS